MSFIFLVIGFVLGAIGGYLFLNPKRMYRLGYTVCRLEVEKEMSAILKDLQKMEDDYDNT